MRQILDDGFMMVGAGDIVRLTISLVIFGICVVLFRKRRGTAMWMLLVGSFTYAAHWVFWDFLLVLGFYKMKHGYSWFTGIFFPTSTNAAWTGMLSESLFWLGVVLFPL